MIVGKVACCFIALALVSVVYGAQHGELLSWGFQYFPGVGYYYYGSYSNWTFAQKDCISSGARLAVINSEKERQTIVSFLSNHTQDDYTFLGFTNRYETQYVTTEGVLLKKVGYTKWETGKPSSLTDRCGGINTITGELTDLPCDEATSYVCEHQLWTEYVYAKGVGYYKFHTEGKGWDEAHDICVSEGAHLLILDSQAEADAVKEIYDQYPDLPNADSSKYFHIGFRAVIEDLNDDPYNGTYLTIFGTSVSDLGYVKWHEDEPHPRNEYFCGTLFRNDTAYYMSHCTSILGFFCERELQVFKR